MNTRETEQLIQDMIMHLYYDLPLVNDDDGPLSWEQTLVVPPGMVIRHNYQREKLQYQGAYKIFYQRSHIATLIRRPHKRLIIRKFMDRRTKIADLIAGACHIYAPEARIEYEK